MRLHATMAMITAITPATEPTTVAMTVILLLSRPPDEPVGEATGEVEVEVGLFCPVFLIPPGVAKAIKDQPCLKTEHLSEDTYLRQSLHHLLLWLTPVHQRRPGRRPTCCKRRSNRTVPRWSCIPGRIRNNY